MTNQGKTWFTKFISTCRMNTRQWSTKFDFAIGNQFHSGAFVFNLQKTYYGVLCSAKWVSINKWAPNLVLNAMKRMQPLYCTFRSLLLNSEADSLTTSVQLHFSSKPTDIKYSSVLVWNRIESQYISKKQVTISIIPATWIIHSRLYPVLT